MCNSWGVPLLWTAQRRWLFETVPPWILSASHFFLFPVLSVLNSSWPFSVKRVENELLLLHDAQTLLLVDVLLVGRLVRRWLDVCVLDGVYLLVHRHVHRGLVLTHVHVSPIALASKRHIAGGTRDGHILIFAIKDKPDARDIRVASHPFRWLIGVLPLEMRQPSSCFFSA